MHGAGPHRRAARRPVLGRPGRRRTSSAPPTAVVDALHWGGWRSSWSPWSASARDWCPAPCGCGWWSGSASRCWSGRCSRSCAPRRRTAWSTAGSGCCWRSTARRRCSAARPRTRAAAPRGRARQVAQRRGVPGILPGTAVLGLGEHGRRIQSQARMGNIRRLAMISLHTSPLDQPGTGDAGGMNVYVVELARRLVAPRRRGRHLHPRHELDAASPRCAWTTGSRSGTSTPARSRG